MHDLSPIFIVANSPCRETVCVGTNTMGHPLSMLQDADPIPVGDLG